jgi:hypothetical protein
MYFERAPRCVAAYGSMPGPSNASRSLLWRHRHAHDAVILLGRGGGRSGSLGRGGNRHARRRGGRDGGSAGRTPRRWSRAGCDDDDEMSVAGRAEIGRRGLQNDFARLLGHVWNQGHAARRGAGALICHCGRWSGEARVEGGSRCFLQTRASSSRPEREELSSARRVSRERAVRLCLGQGDRSWRKRQGLPRILISPMVAVTQHRGRFGDGRRPPQWHSSARASRLPARPYLPIPTKAGIDERSNVHI